MKRRKVLKCATLILVIVLTTSSLVTLFFLDVVSYLFLDRHCRYVRWMLPTCFWYIGKSTFLVSPSDRTSQNVCHELFHLQDQLCAHTCCRKIHYQVLLLTVESYVDVGSGLQWGETNVSCFWPVTLEYHLRVPFLPKVRSYLVRVSYWSYFVLSVLLRKKQSSNATFNVYLITIDI